jgi:hypothetical protein
MVVSCDPLRAQSDGRILRSSKKIDNSSGFRRIIISCSTDVKQVGRNYSSGDSCPRIGANIPTKVV